MVVVELGCFYFFALRLVGRRQKGKKAKGKAIMCFPLALVTQRAGKEKDEEEARAHGKDQKEALVAVLASTSNLISSLSVSAMTPGDRA